MSKWDQGDLEARLCRALDLARKAVNCFSRSRATRIIESPAYDFGPEKVVAETAMLIYAASASRSRPSIASRIDDLARLLAPHARSRRVLVDIALHPALAFKFAVPHVLLTKLGYPDASFDDFLRSCASAQTGNAQDRPPSSSLERRWIQSLWTGRDSEAGWRAGLRELGAQRAARHSGRPPNGRLRLHASDFLLHGLWLWKASAASPPVRHLDRGRRSAGAVHRRRGLRSFRRDSSRLAAHGRPMESRRRLRFPGSRQRRGSGRRASVRERQPRPPRASSRARRAPDTRSAPPTIRPMSWGSCAPRRCGPAGRRRRRLPVIGSKGRVLPACWLMSMTIRVIGAPSSQVFQRTSSARWRRSFSMSRSRKTVAGATTKPSPRSFRSPASSASPGRRCAVRRSNCSNGLRTARPRSACGTARRATARPRPPGSSGACRRKRRLALSGALQRPRNDARDAKSWLRGEAQGLVRFAPEPRLDRMGVPVDELHDAALVDRGIGAGLVGRGVNAARVFFNDLRS